MKLATRIFRRSDWTLNSPFGVSRIINGVRDVHNGTDYGTYGQKWPQYALEDGIVTVADKDKYGAIYCWVYYPRIGMEVQYFHLDKMFVKKGQKVTEDTIIGNTGTTGRSTGIHLHLALRKFGSTARLDPDKYEYTPPDVAKPTAKQAAGEINIGDRVRIKKIGVPYFPGGVKIPARLLGQMFTVNGLATKGGAQCARLEEIITWCDAKNLEKV